MGISSHSHAKPMLPTGVRTKALSRDRNVPFPTGMAAIGSWRRDGDGEGALAL